MFIAARPRVRPPLIHTHTHTHTHTHSERDITYTSPAGFWHRALQLTAMLPSIDGMADR
jgi:hypothetical protein